MVDLDSLLSQISSRLITLDSIDADTPAEKVERVQYLTFALNGAYYGVEVSFVGEVISNPRITHVPGMPGWILGVTNLHGNIISVVDLRIFIDGLQTSVQAAEMLFVARAGDQTIGLVVDEVKSIYTFPVAQIFSPPFSVEDQMVAYLRGAVDREGTVVRLLDCERLLLGPQMQQFA